MKSPSHSPITQFLIAMCLLLFLAPLAICHVNLEAAEKGAQKEYRLLGNEKGFVIELNKKGEVIWKFKNRGPMHDIWRLPNGNTLMCNGPSTVIEVTAAKKIVWKYTSKPVNGYKGKIEVHAFQPLEDGKVMIAETGNKRIIEVDKNGKICTEIPLKVDNPHHHTDTRMVRKLDSGNYLVCHERDGAVREYDSTGKIVWEYKLDLGGRPVSPGHGVEGHGTSVYGAVRLKNGNTLIAGGNNNRVLEVTPEKKIVWSIDQKELPGITLAWVTSLHVLPNGNIIIGNCHAGPANPQLIEVNKKKQVIWKFNDFKNFGNSLATVQILGVKGDVIR